MAEKGKEGRSRWRKKGRKEETDSRRREGRKVLIGKEGRKEGVNGRKREGRKELRG
jgi:hypothetical protein